MQAREHLWTILRIVSGGQTGADRAALDWAILHQIPHGGWCPKGRKAEDGTLDQRYQLEETPSADYAQRTAWNARDSDGTVIFSLAPYLTGGSQFTWQCALDYKKPCLHISQQNHHPHHSARLLAFLQQHKIHVLNVAGPRASTEPEIATFVTDILEQTYRAAKAD